jgi:hypothetical protein
MARSTAQLERLTSLPACSSIGPAKAMAPRRSTRSPAASASARNVRSAGSKAGNCAVG